MKVYYRDVTFQQTIEKTVRIYSNEPVVNGEDPRNFINNTITFLENNPDEIDFEKNFDFCCTNATMIGDLKETDWDSNIYPALWDDRKETV